MGYLKNPKYGERFWEESRRFSHAEYNFTSPFDRTGEPRLYLRILRILAIEGPTSKKDILSKLRLSREKNTNHYNDVFHALSQTGMAFYHPKSRSWRLGPHYHTWANEFLGPKSGKASRHAACDTKKSDLSKLISKLQEIIDTSTPETSIRMSLKVVKKRSLRPNEIFDMAIKALQEQSFDSMAEMLIAKREGMSLADTVSSISKYLIIDLVDHRYVATN